MMSPLFTLEAEETIAFKLFDKWVRFDFLVQFCLGGEDFPDEVGIGDGKPDGGTKPN